LIEVTVLCFNFLGFVDHIKSLMKHVLITVAG